MQTTRIGKKLLAGTCLTAALLLAVLVGVGEAASQAAPVNTGPPTIRRYGRVGQDTQRLRRYVVERAYGLRLPMAPLQHERRVVHRSAERNSEDLRLVGADAGHQMRVRVTASNADGSAAAQSDATSTVASATVPRNTDRPIISGTPEVGEVLTSDDGSWTGGPTSFAYRWQHCEADNIVSCFDIPGATGKTYTTRAGDIGYRLRIEVTAKNANGSAVATSATTAVIRPKHVANGAPSLSIISLRVLGHTAYARFRVCDDSNKNLTIIQTTSRAGALSYTRRFSTLAAPRPCGVYTRHWGLVSRFRGHRVTVTLIARDKSGSSSVPARRTLLRG